MSTHLIFQTALNRRKNEQSVGTLLQKWWCCFRNLGV